jgi:Fe-S-cluster-containing hydrogenase component 2
VFKGIAIKCDLCGGDPKCVKHCAPNALELMTSDRVAAKKRREHAAVVMRPKLRKLGVK